MRTSWAWLGGRLSFAVLMMSACGGSDASSAVPSPTGDGRTKDAAPGGSGGSSTDDGSAGSSTEGGATETGSETGGAAGTAGSAGSSPGCPGLEPLAEPPERVFVAPDGDDAASGSESEPLASLGEAARRLPNGGTVIVRGGQYPQQGWFDAAGTDATPLYIRAADGETPIFDGSDVQSDWSAVISMASASHVVLEGLEVRNCSASGCRGIASGDAVLDLTVRGCHIHHMDGPAARFAGSRIRLEGNDIHDVALMNEDNVDYPNGGWPTCMGTTPDRSSPTNPWADDVVIRGNRIRDCWGEGIGLWYASNAVVEDNSVENAFNVGIYADNARHLRIARNYVHTLRGMHGGQGQGVLFGTEEYSGLPNTRTSDVDVKNNVIVGGGAVGWWAMDTPESTYEGIRVQHNTLVGTARGALNFSRVQSGVDSPTGCVVRNNVIAEASESWLGDPSAFVFGGNAWLGGSRPGVAGTSDVVLDIEMPTLGAALDARPLAALVGKGEADTGVLDDFLCAVRNTTAPTRGAFEE